MTATELKAALGSLGWSQAELGRRIDQHPNSISRWMRDRSEPIPGAVAAYVRLSVAVRELAGMITS